MIRSWYCPQCKKTDRTNDSGVGTRFHVCPKMRFLSTPMVLAGVSAKLVLNERQDYVGKEHVQLDPERKRPMMNMQTVRDNGIDTIVYAPTARGEARA